MSLADELRTNPARLPYTGDDVADAALLNAPLRDGLRPIDSTELLAWAGGNGRAAKLSDAATVHTSMAVRSIAWVAVKLVERDGTKLDLRLSDRAAMLAALVSAGVLAQSDATALYKMAATKISRADELGLGHVTESHIADARRA